MHFMPVEAAQSVSDAATVATLGVTQKDFRIFHLITPRQDFSWCVRPIVRFYAGRGFGPLAAMSRETFFILEHRSIDD